MSPDPPRPTEPRVVEVGDPGRLPARPLVSVLMMTYRHARFLGEAIEGVVRQDRPFGVELVIGEDCSPDDTRDVALSFQRRHPELIRVLSADRNVGSHANLQRLVAASRGEILAFCEGDDYWVAPDKLVRQVEVLRSRPEVSACFHAALRLDHASDAFVSVIERGDEPRDYALADVVFRDGGFMPTASIVLRRSAMCPPIEWMLRCPVGDYPLSIWAASRGTVAYLPEAMSVYRSGVPGSWSRSIRGIEDRWKHVRGILAMLAGAPAATGRPDALAAVRRVRRRYARDFHVQYGTREARTLEGYEELEACLAPVDRALAAGCAIPGIWDVLRLGSEVRWRIARRRAVRRRGFRPHPRAVGRLGPTSG